MKTCYLFACSILLLSSFFAEGADPVRKPPALPLSLIGKTLAWQLHWDQQLRVESKGYSKVTSRMRDQWEVWVEELDWIVSFNYRGMQPFPNHLLRLHEVPAEVGKRDVEPFDQLPRTVVNVPGYTNTFRRVSSYKLNVRERLLSCFQAEACTKSSISNYTDEMGKPVSKVRFWIAPVDVEFPVIMYFVEGVPYIGKVYFDTQSLRPVYSEFNYITDKGSKWHREGLKLMMSIKAEGDSFDFKEGRLVQVPH